MAFDGQSTTCDVIERHWRKHDAVTYIHIRICIFMSRVKKWWNTRYIRYDRGTAYTLHKRQILQIFMLHTARVKSKKLRSSYFFDDIRSMPFNQTCYFIFTCFFHLPHTMDMRVNRYVHAKIINTFFHYSTTVDCPMEFQILATVK